MYKAGRCEGGESTEQWGWEEMQRRDGVGGGAGEEIGQEECEYACVLCACGHVCVCVCVCVVPIPRFFGSLPHDEPGIIPWLHELVLHYVTPSIW